VWRPNAVQWWIDLHLAELDQVAGRGLLADGRSEAAIPRLEAAIAGLSPIGLESLPHHLLAQARVALAQALLVDPPASARAERRARAHELAAAAEVYYRDAGPGYRARLEALTTWREGQALP
jgi:hypothetical protein